MTNYLLSNTCSKLSTVSYQYKHFIWTFEQVKQISSSITEKEFHMTPSAAGALATQ